MRFDLLARLIGLALIVALSFGCKSPAAKPSGASNSNGRAESESKPPPLAVETFQTVWETIRDTHFDTNFNGLDWNGVRETYLPRIERARSNEDVRETIQSMLDLLNVSHLRIIAGAPARRPIRIETNAAPTLTLNPSPAQLPQPTQTPIRAEAGSIGIEVRVLNGQIVVSQVEPDGPAERAGIKPGWIVKKIDGEPAVDANVKEARATERQREFLMWHDVAGALKGSAGEPCALVVKTDSGEVKTLKIPRERETGQPAKLGNLPTMFTKVVTNEITTTSGKSVGYLSFNLWLVPAVSAIDRFVDANRNSDAIIIDLRGNLGGIGGMVVGVAGHFVNGRAPLGKMKMRENELNFTAFPRRVDLHMQPTNTFQGKLAIIVDALSLSSAELFAGGMQELGRARIFGQPTGGQALPAMSDRLPNGDLFYHAIADFNTPKGRRLEGNGVVPDEIVPLRLEALRAGIDEPLQAALRWIDSTPQSAESGVK